MKVVGIDPGKQSVHGPGCFAPTGNEVRLITPPFVKPYMKSNKNDAVDAKAACEAAQRPTRRFSAIKI